MKVDEGQSAGLVAVHALVVASQNACGAEQELVVTDTPLLQSMKVLQVLHFGPWSSGAQSTGAPWTPTRVPGTTSWPLLASKRVKRTNTEIIANFILGHELSDGKILIEKIWEEVGPFIPQLDSGERKR